MIVELRLKDGMIPAGMPCPFLDKCVLRDERCPSTGNLKKWEYSCAAARAFEISTKSNEGQKP